MASGTSGAAPHTSIVPGQGSSAVTYTLPAGIYQYIESVVATVDTSGSGDVTPVLTVADDSGTVIADKEQARAITAGGSGRATWALRLTDEQQSLTGFIHWGTNTDTDGIGLTLLSGFYIFEDAVGNLLVAFNESSGMQFHVPFGGVFTVQDTAGERIDVTDDGDTTLTTFDGKDIKLLADPSGGFVVVAAHSVQIDGQHGGVAVSAENGSNITLVTGVSGGEIEIEGPTVVKLDAAGQSLAVHDSGNNPIFEVRNDGTVHIKTGQTVIADL